MTNIFVLPNEEINIIGFENQIYGCPTNLKKLSDIIINITRTCVNILIKKYQYFTCVKFWRYRCS